MTITPNVPEFKVEFRLIIKIIKELSVIYAKLLNQKKFKYHTLFSASIHKINEDDQRNNETELFINLNINHKITESDFDIIYARPPLEHQIQIQETKESGWIFDKIISMKISFYKTGELNGSSFVKIPLKSSPLINTKNFDKNYFVWSDLASLRPCNNDHPIRISKYKQKHLLN